MIVDFEHHYIPAELGRRFGLDPDGKKPVRTREALVHSQLFDMEAQIRDMDRSGIGVAVTRLIAGGVVERYPDLQFVFAQFGGGLAGYKERIARSSYRFKLPRSCEDYFDRLYFDMAGFEGSPIALRCALEAIRPERLIFATDYPQNFNNTDPKQGRSVDGIGEYVSDIRRLPLDAKVKEDMLGGTAAGLLKIAR
jgi:predicted TIM-barrel fold metal-dependent hydrolase